MGFVPGNGVNASVGIRIAFVFVAVVAAVAGKTVQLADADDLQTSLRLKGKSGIAIGHGTVPGATTTLDGTDQVAEFVLPLTVTDARGTGAGWNLSVTSTTFATTAGATLADDAATLAGVVESCAGAGTCTGPANVLAYPLAVPADASAPPAVVFFDAAAGTGLGAFELDTTVDVAIPGNTYAGRYKSTLTFSAATGP
jgi:hypothetical protein